MYTISFMGSQDFSPASHLRNQAMCLNTQTLRDFTTEWNMVVAAMEFVMYTYAWYAMKTKQGLDTVLQAHILKLERNLRVFQGHWRDKTKQYFHHNIGAFTGFSSLLLDHSYFTVAGQILRQCRGASMNPNLLC